MGMVDVITQVTGLERPANDAAEIACADHLAAVAIKHGEVHRIPFIKRHGLLREP
ncbi:hypothetical protein D3C86_2226450 [compost metagenome]